MSSRRAPVLSEFSQRLIDQGVTAGKAQAVLAVLAGRGIAVPEAVAQRVLACSDPDELDAWLTRSGVVASAEDLIR